MFGALIVCANINYKYYTTFYFISYYEISSLQTLAEY